MTPHAARFFAIISLATVLLSACQQIQSPPSPPALTLSGAQANAIVAAASRAQYDTRFSTDKNWDHISIPPQFWPPELAGLHPIRVWQHHGNIVIVLTQTAQGEDGWYVHPSISSFFPMDNSEFTLEPMLPPPDPTQRFAQDSFPADSQLHRVPLTTESPQGRLITVSSLYHYRNSHPSPPSPTARGEGTPDSKSTSPNQ